MEIMNLYILLITLLFFIKEHLSVLTPIKIDTSPYQPVNQIISGDESMIHIFAGDKSYSYNSNTPYQSTNYLNGVATTKSTVVVRLGASRLVLACWTKDIVLMTFDEGIVDADTSTTSFNLNFRCSFTRLSAASFFLAYSDSTSTFFNRYSYDETTIALTSDSFQLNVANQSTECVGVKTIICIYYDIKAFIVYLELDMTLMAPALEINRIEGNPFVIQLTSPVVIVMMLTDSIANAYMFQLMAENNVAIPPEPAYIKLTVPQKDLHLADSVQLSSISATFIQKNILILIIGCSDAKCYCKYFDLSLAEQLTPFAFDIPPGGTNSAVSLLLFDTDKLSIIISQSDFNYLLHYPMPNCTNLGPVYGHYTGPFRLKDISNDVTDKLSIAFITGIENIFIEYTDLPAEGKTFYPFNVIYFDFKVANLYAYSYSLIDENQQKVSNCILSFAVCHWACTQCYAYGSEDQTMCLSCAIGYFSLYSSPDSCVSKEQCFLASGFILEETTGGKCVTSCKDHNFLTDVDDQVCVTKCKATKIENKIGRECLTEDGFKKKMDFYVKNIDEYGKNLYEHYPRRMTDEYIMSIYNTSILPQDPSLEGISLGSPYDIIFVSSVDLGACEAFLKEYYHLDLTKPLLIAKFDRKIKKQLSNQVGYTVFSYDGMLLDHSLCEDSNNSITVISPISDEGSSSYTLARSYSYKSIDVFESADPFFNNICYPFTSEYLTDVPLVNRLEDMFLDEAMLCNEGCKYKSIDYERNTVLCSCSKEAVHLYKENYDNIFASLTSFWTQSNFAVVECANLVFDAHRFSNNIGSWFLLFLLVIEALAAAFFFLTKFKVIENELLTVSSDKRQKQKDVLEQYLSKKTSREDRGASEKKLETLNDKLNAVTPAPLSIENAGPNPQRNMMVYSTHNISSEENHKALEELAHSAKKSKENDSMEGQRLKDSELHLNQDNKLIDNKLYEDHRNTGSKRKTFNFNLLSHPKDLFNTSKEQEKYDNQRINKEKVDAVQVHTRNSKPKSKSQKVPKQAMMDLERNPDVIIDFNISNFRFCYWSFLRTLHPILRSFFIKTSHKTRVVHISMFFFCIAISFTLNALFFSEKYVSKSYKTQGGINFLFNIPKMIYSFILSYAMKIIFNLLSSVGSVITTLSKKSEMDKKKLVIQKLKMKLTIFYVLKLVFICFFWYYVAAFCAVYPNIQMTWIISSLTTFLLEMLFPFGLAVALTFVLILSTRYRVKWLISITKGFSLT